MSHFSSFFRFGLPFMLTVSVFMTTNLLIAQRHHRFFYGNVADEGTKKPMNGVNIRVEGTTIGTVTDKSGTFSFFTDSVPARLIMSYMGYETREILLDETSYRLSVYMRKKPLELKEVEIRAQSVEPWFRDERFAVLDYEVDSNMVWLLIFRQRLANAEVIVRNLTGDTLNRSGAVTFRPQKLFRDCTGQMHILGQDSGYQLFRSAGWIQLIHGVKLKKFDDVLKNCVESDEKTIYFKKVTDAGMNVEYYGVNRKTFVRKSIQKVSDEEKLRMMRRNPDDSWLLMNTKPPESRDDFVTWNYVHKILYRPVKSELFRAGAYICIFNPPVMELEFYDHDGNYSYKLALQTDKVHDGRWNKDAMIDRISGKIYTSFLRNGWCTLYEINTDNGMLIKRLTLEYPYPEKIRVYGGWVWYLYDVSSEADNKVLFRQRID